ncbi:MAG: hypothetical protein ACLRXQ_05345 [Phascolarctobacterium faecium]
MPKTYLYFYLQIVPTLLIFPEVLKETSDFIWLYEDTANFIAGRIEAAIDTI